MLILPIRVVARRFIGDTSSPVRSVDSLAGHHPWRILAAAAAVAVLLVAAGSVLAQQPRVAVRNVTYGDYPVVSVVVDVTDSRGFPLTDLTIENVSALENGKAVVSPSLLSQVDAQLPLSIVMLVDTSGSMAGAPLQNAKVAAGTFLDQLGPQDRVAVIAFSREVRELQGFTADRQAARATLNGLVAGGGTKLYDGLYAAADLALRSGLENTIVVLLTDGEDTESERGLEDAIRLASSRAIPVYAIGLGAADRAVLERVAEATGGASLFAPQASALTAAYQQIAQRLKSFYVLTYTSPLRSGPPERTLQVTVRYGAQQLVGSTTFVLDLPPLQLSVENLAAGDSLDTERTVKISVDRPQWVDELRFTLNGRLLRKLTGPPFETVLNPKDFKPGDHTLGVTVLDVIQREVSQSVSFTIPGATPGPTPPPAERQTASRWWLALRWLRANSTLPLALMFLVLATLALGRQGIARWKGVHCPSCNRRYHTRGGCPVCNDHLKVETQRLGEILVRAGLITAEQLEKTLQTSISQKKLLGRVLVEEGHITREQLRSALRIQEKQVNFALRLRTLFEGRERNLASGEVLLVYAAGVVLGVLFLYLYTLSLAS